MSLNKPFFSRLTGDRWWWLAVILLVGGAYSWLQAAPSFRDPDSFFHAGMTLLTGSSGPVTEFSWLPSTVLAGPFADHHFLYHLLSLPAVWMFGPLAGLKLMTVFLGVVAALVFAWVVQRLGQRYGWVFALLLATSADLMFRFNLAKASSLAVILLLLTFLAAVRGRWWMVFVLAWIHVWAHGSWPLQPFIVLAAAVSGFLVGRFRSHERALVSSRKLWTSVGLSFLGTAFGLVLNPFFPGNLSFYWNQTIQVALVGLPDRVRVGIEWYPYAPLDLLRQNGVIFVLLLVLVGLWLGQRLVGRNLSERSNRVDSVSLLPTLAAGLIAATFLLLALKSRRHVEFMSPFALLFLSLAYARLLSRSKLSELLPAMLYGRRRLAVAVTAYVLLVIVMLPVRDLMLVHRSLRQGARDWSQFAVVGEWMRSNLPDGSVVFNGDWSDFPLLFFRYPEGRYVIGLDAGFLYLRDPKLYDDWSRVSSGLAAGETSEIMVESFGARYLLVRRDQSDLLRAAESDSDLQSIYRDEEVQLFTLR